MSSTGYDMPSNQPNLDEDLAVYTWGEASYHGLGDVLDERDELNDETFGSSDTVGKDFDFAGQTLAALPVRSPIPRKPQPPPLSAHSQSEALWQSLASTNEPLREPTFNNQFPNNGGPQPSSDIVHHGLNFMPAATPKYAPKPTSFAPFDEMPPRANNLSTSNPPVRSVRTMEEVEAELRLAMRGYDPGATPVPQPPSVNEPGTLYATMPHSFHSQGFGDGFIEGYAPAQTSQSLHQSSMSMGLPHQTLGQSQFPQHLSQGQQDFGLGYPGHPMDMLAQTNHPHLSQSLDQFLAGGDPRAMAANHEEPGPSTVLDIEQRDALMGEAMKKIMQAEQMEERRRRKTAKMVHMARYNDLMTQSDKDFITRIQVSQLVTQDPYTEDFYAQVFSAIIRSRIGAPAGPDKSLLKFGGGTGVGLGVPGRRGAGRHESAMQRMQTQVERIVNNAQIREKEKSDTNTVNSLHGVLGKVSGRSYKAAPRQLLQVNGAPTNTTGSQAAATEDHDGLSKNAAKLGREALSWVQSPTTPDNGVRRPPLTHRQVQVAIEGLYDSVLALEQLRRDVPPREDKGAFESWESAQASLNEQLWTRAMVMVPVETSDPHPFISILSPSKGKRLLPRLMRLLSDSQVSLLMVLFLACFHQLDVVRSAPILDRIDIQGSPDWKQIATETDTFLSVLPSVTSVFSGTSLRLLTGFLNIMLGAGKHAVLQVAKSQPGIALLTAFMSRVDQLQNDTQNEVLPEDWTKWHNAFDGLLSILQGGILLLFPSNRVAISLPPGFPIPNLDLADQIVWQLLAALAANGSQGQQMQLVAEVKDMILEIVQSVHGGWISDPHEATTKLVNVNFLLRAIGLDDTQLLAS